MAEILRPHPSKTNWQGSNPKLETFRQIAEEMDGFQSPVSGYRLATKGMVHCTNAFGRSYLVNKQFILEFNRAGEILRLELGDEAAFALIDESQERVYLQTMRKVLERLPQGSRMRIGWKAYLDFMLDESD